MSTQTETETLESLQATKRTNIKRLIRTKYLYDVDDKDRLVTVCLAWTDKGLMVGTATRNPMDHHLPEQIGRNVALSNAIRTVKE